MHLAAYAGPFTLPRGSSANHASGRCLWFLPVKGKEVLMAVRHGVPCDLATPAGERTAPTLIRLPGQLGDGTIVTARLTPDSGLHGVGHRPQLEDRS
jgi:hypothetical protein